MLKSYIKMEKTIIKFEDIEIQKQKFHQHQRPISMKKLQILIKQQYLIRSFFGKNGFEYFIDYKDSKNIKSYVYISQK